MVWPAKNEKGGNPLLAAVHIEMADKERRQCNVVITGLNSSEEADDVVLLNNLCEEVMDIKPVLVVDKCKRLGKKTPGKVQPLLIVMANVDTAQQIIRDSRRLRDFAKWKTTYINPDLTPSQSRAAYQERVRRREKKSTTALEHNVNNG